MVNVPVSRAIMLHEMYTTNMFFSLFFIVNYRTECLALDTDAMKSLIASYLNWHQNPSLARQLGISIATPATAELQPITATR
jgi:hypothetical protein